MAVFDAQADTVIDDDTETETETDEDSDTVAVPDAVVEDDSDRVCDPEPVNDPDRDCESVIVEHELAVAVEQKETDEVAVVDVDGEPDAVDENELESVGDAEFDEVGEFEAVTDCEFD